MSTFGWRLVAGGAFKRQIVLVFLLGFLCLFSALVAYLVRTQSHSLYEENHHAARGLAYSLAVSSRSWVLANDLVGLEEVIVSFASYPHLRYAMVLSPTGRVLAHTDPSKMGLFVSDTTSAALLHAPTGLHQLLVNDAETIDVAVPIALGARHLGWARVALGRESIQAELRAVLVRSLAFVALAAVLALLAAIMIANRLARRIAALVQVADSVRAGDTRVRAHIAGAPDEITLLAESFNRMLDALAHNEQALHTASRYSRSLIEAHLDPLLVVGCNGHITDLNRAAETMTGRSRQALIGTDFADHCAEREQAHALFVQALANEQVIDQTLSIRHVDGHVTKVLYNAGIFRSATGEVLGVLAAARDVTERQRLDEEMHRYQDRLEAEVQQRTADLVLARNAAETANQAKSAFLANMSHELRTPLNAVLGFSNMMRKDPLLPERQRQNLDIINRSGEHLLTLINDVLDMAKIEAGRVQLQQLPFDLGALVRDVTDMMQIRAQEKGLQLLIDQDSEFPRYIVGDEARLRQVLINLLGNAVKFTEQGGVSIRLGTQQNQQSHLVIEIEDSGLGIAPEDQESIFLPFTQIGEQGINKGTGLGLTITRQFVQLMHGQITLHSRLGTGSVFRIELPLQEASEADMHYPDAIQHGDVLGLAPGQQPWRILIVEDQRDNQILLSQLLGAIGFEWRISENGAKGVQMFQEWHPDFIWMDHRMPVMDGVEATRRIRQLPGGQEVKIVAVTASALQEQKTELLAAGMDDFVRKPYRSSEIFDCMAKHLGVRYLYEGLPEVDDNPTTALTPEMFASLPRALCQQFQQALESLEDERITAALQAVAAQDAVLGKALQRLVNNFAYPAILTLLEARTHV
ncbi:ATP-binding protein [Giesbergeria anulus]|uniref:Virulence sensor protein BvgS n=1 Tax=Giesbergeria anulus TaxID=180197 RepID=A0A1H9PPG8_9BURK|nr:ATP-binding protein [Giesbergeria anulus]SER50092.1 PAS domain S-box-containing protein [Giesbergeria anulus]